MRSYQGARAMTKSAHSTTRFPAALGRIVGIVALLMGIAAANRPAQAACPPAWSNVKTLYGTLTLRGELDQKSGELEQRTNQTITANVKAEGGGQCSWTAAGFGAVGSYADLVSIDDSMQESCGGNPPSTTTITAQGRSILYFTAPPALVIQDSTVLFYGIVNATSTVIDCFGKKSSQTVQDGWGSFSQLQLPPLPSSATNWSGTYSYTAKSADLSLPTKWKVTWNLSPFPDDTVDDPCHAAGSDIGCQNQSLGENITIVGTPFFLRYQSDRAAGYAGADTVATQDAMSLGGWTLNVHHAFQPAVQQYCAGGGCTPYAVTPKALFLGDGRTRTDAKVQGPVLLNSEIYLTSEDGSEVYIFDGASGRHLETVGPLTGAVIYQFTYDNSDQLSSVVDASGNVTQILRDANDHPTAIISPYGQTTALAVDGNGYLSQVTDPAGHAVRLVHSPLGLLTQMTDARGNTYNFQYSHRGRLTTDADPAGGSTTLARADGASGYSVTKTTALHRTSAYSVGFSSAASQTAQTSVNTGTNGLQTTEVDTQQPALLSRSMVLPDGTSYSETDGPDPRWGIQVPIPTHEKTTIGDLTRKSNYSRTATLGAAGDPFSLLTQTDLTTINGRTYTSTYTASDRTLVNTSPEGRTQTVVLDDLERVSSMQTSGLLPTNLAYDARGRLESVTRGPRTTTLAYHASGRLATVTDPLGRAKSFTYDAAGNLATTTLPDGNVVHYQHDANGNLVALTPPGGSAHHFAYTPVNLRSAYTPPTLPGTGGTTYSYDADRDPVSVARPDGTTVNDGYDSAGRLSSLTTPITTINYTYGANTGNLTAESVTGGEALAYGYIGSLPTSSSWAGKVAGDVGVAYDDNFWVTSQTVNNAHQIEFAHDNDGLLVEAGSLVLSRDPGNGLVTSTRLGATNDTRTYNGFGELNSYTANSGTTPVYAVKFARDRVGRIIAKTESIGGRTNTFTYNYDLNGRLTTVSQNGVAVASYTYNANSDRLAVTTAFGTATATYDAQDRLLTDGSDLYSYTHNGEVASRTIGIKTTDFVYDDFGNLLAVKFSNGSVIEYIIDSEGRRVGKLLNGTLGAGYLYQGSQIVAQLNSAGKVISRFVYATHANSPDYMVISGVAYRIFSDQLGSPRMVVNTTTGAIAEEIDYDEFGNVINDTNPGFQPFGFAGGLYDSDTKLVHFGAREYDPRIGRWITKDPILFAGGDTNLYSYSRNDPVNSFDPIGLNTIVVITRDLGFGDHAALWIENNGSPVLYDPGGAFGRPGVGADAVIENANLNDYISFQQGEGSAVETYSFATSREEEAAIMERIRPSDTSIGEGEGGVLTCSVHVSNVLAGIGRFKHLGAGIRFPGNLAGALGNFQSSTQGFWGQLETFISSVVGPGPTGSRIQF
jgi:RHS repeat-associated protein